MKIIIRSSNGDLREQEVTQDMNFTPTQGEHLYFTGVESYQFQLVNDNSTMNVYFMTNDGEKINIVLNDMAELIQQNNPMDPFSVDTIFGVSTNAQGDQQIDAALHNPEFESGEIIEALKEALSLDGSTVAGGAIIDDFQAMLDNMEATAAGGPEDTAYLTPEEQNQLDELNDAAADEGNPESPEDTPPTSTPPPSNTYTETTLSISGMTTVYEGDEASYQLTVTQAPFVDMIVDVTITDITTNGDVVLETIQVTIPAGSTTSEIFTIDNVDDNIKENPEDYSVAITGNTSGGFDQVNYGDTEVVTTITDDVPNNPAGPEDLLTFQLFAADASGNVSTDASVIYEDGETSAYYVVLAVDANGTPLATQPTGTVDVSFNNNGTTTGADYTSSTTSATIGTAFSATAIDDVLADNGETFTVELEGNYSEASTYEKVTYNDATVTTTIVDETSTTPTTDDDNAFTFQLFAADASGNVSTDASVIYEDGETSAYYVVLAVDANGTPLATQPTGTVDVSFNNNGTTTGADYTSSTTSATIGTAFSATAIDDVLADNGETFTVELEGNYSEASTYEKVTYNDATVTTTIVDETSTTPTTDDDNAFTFQLFAADASGNVSTDASVIYEDGETSAYYVVLAVDANGTPLATQPTGTVDVSFNNNGTTTGADYTSSTTSATIGTAFSATAIDDVLADNGETFTVELEGNYSEASTYEKVTYNDATVTTTIVDETSTTPTTDDDNAFTFQLFAADASGNVSTDASVIYEDGETSAYYVVLAVDANGTPLATQPTGTVDVSFNNNGTTTGADYTSSTTSATIGTAFSATAIDDVLADNGETFTVELEGNYSEASTYEKVTYNDATVTTTIVDETSTTPTTDDDNAFTFQLFAADASGNVSTDASVIYEDGETSAYYVVLAVDANGTPLATQPTGTVDVSFNNNGTTTGADYTSSTTSATIGTAFSATAIDDVLADNGETFTVELEGNYSEASTYEKVTYNDATVTTTIVDETSTTPTTDDDNAFTFQLFAADASGNVSTDASVIYEDGETSAYYVVLAVDANGTPLATQPTGTVDVSFNNNGTTTGADYTSSTTSATIGTAFSATAIDDVLADNGETFTVELEGNYSEASTYEKVTYNDATVTTTIVDETSTTPTTDDDNAFTFQLFAADASGNVSTDASVIYEDGETSAYYVVLAVDANGTPLATQPTGTVDVSFNNNGTTTGADYTSSTTSATIGTAFSATAIDDVLADNGETFTVELEGNYSEASTYEKVTYNDATVTTTIVDETSTTPTTDDDNAFTFQLFAADASGNVSTDASVIYEDGETSAYYVVLAVDANGTPLATQPTGTVDVSFNNNGTTTGADYTSSTTSATIGTAFSATAIDDVLADNGETFTVELEGNYSEASTYEKVTYNDATVTTTIVDETSTTPTTDDDNAFTFQLFAADASGNVSTDASVIYEDGETSAYYVVLAVDANGTPLATQPTGTVDVSFNNNGTTTGADYTSSTTSATIGTAFSATAIDDVLADNGETFTVELEGNYSEASTYEKVTYNDATVTTTIVDETSTTPTTDDDNAFTFQLFAADASGNVSTDASVIYEDGETSAYYVVLAVDANGTPLATQPTGTVDVSFNNNGTTTGADYTSSTTSATIGTAFSATAIDDVLADNGETFTVELEGNYSEASTYEKVTYNDATVTTTIVDETSTTPTTDDDNAFTFQLFAADASGNVSTDASVIYEDGETSAYYVVLAVDANGTPLATQPTGTVDVSFNNNGTTTGADYTSSTTSATIGTAFSATAIDDVLADNGETFTVELEGNYSEASTYEKVTYNDATVTTTIVDETSTTPTTDDDNAFTFQLFAADASGNVSTDASVIYEDGETSAYYVVLAVDANGTPLATQPTGTVDVSFNNNGTTTGADYTSSTTSATIGTAFSATAIDDVLADNGETFTVELEGNYSEASTYEKVTYNDATVTTTIVDETSTTPTTDDDNAFTFQLFAADASGNVSTDASVIYEDGETSAYYVVLAVDANGTPLATQPTGTVDVSFNNNGTTTGADYTSSTTSATIGTAFSATAIDDVLADNGETFTVELEGNYSEASTYEKVTYNDATVTTTIVDETSTTPTTDDDNAFTFQLFAADASGNVSTDASVIYEDGETSAYYVVLAVDANGTPLATQPTGTVDVSFNNNGTTTGADYTSSTTSATIGTAFSATAIDDVLADNGETFTVELEGNYSEASTYEKVTYNDATVTTTIVDETSTTPTTDDDNAFTFQLFAADASGNVSTDASVIYEDGETSAYYVVLAVDANGTPLATQPTGTVDVSFNNNGTTTGADYTSSTTSATIGTAFSATAIDDVLADNGETFTVELEGNYSEASTYEKVTYNDATVTTTIVDETSTTPTTDDDNAFTFQLFAADASGNVSTDASVIYEDGETSAYYVVLAVDANGTPLATQPTGTVDVSFNNNGTTTGADYTSSTTSATIGTAFSATAIDDVLADNGETFTVELEGNYSEASTYEKVTYNDATVTTTIVDETSTTPTTDDDNAFTFQLFAADASGNVSTDASVIYEDGETSAYYVVLAVDANGTPLATQPTGTVDVSFNNNGTTTGADYTSSTTSATIGTAFSATAIDDVLADNGETFTVELEGNYSEASTYEKVTYNDATVTTTIVDNDIAPEAKDNTNTATETGAEFIAAEDEANDGQSATGNVITDTQADIGSNPLSITAINFNGSVINIPTNGDDITITGDYGTLTINNTGAYTYDVNESITDSWNVGKSEIDQFTYTLSDGYNPDDTAKLSITVEGKDDAPVITSISANDRATHTIDGLIDIDGDGIADEYTPDDLTQSDKGLIFAGENGDLNINMGTVSSSMSVEYNGGQASYHNAIGYYLADENGNPTEAHIIYVEDASFVGTQAEMLGTLNNLVGNVGFFIIPDGGDKNITTESEITFDNQGNMIINNTTQTVYYSDNDLNSDNHDHVVATVNENGGLILGFEDLSLGDKDYDDVVLTIKLCDTLSETNQILTNIELSDVDDTNLASATIVLKNYQASDEIKYENLPNGISGNSEIINGTLVITLSGSATIGQYEDALESLTFTTTSEDRTPREFAFTVNDGDKTSNEKIVTVDIGGCSLNTGDYINPPVADAVLTTSNLDTDDAVIATFASKTNTPDVEDIAFFKKLDIGGGLDGDITNAENDSSDPADLGGSDIETTENNLVFDITSLPTYGDVYIQVGDVYTKLDASNLDEASTLLDTADTVYWSATHEQVNTYTNTVTNLVQNSIGGDYTSSDIQSSWQSDDVTVIARDENNQEASINYVTNDGIGVSGNTGSGPSNQLGYDPTAQKAESIIFDFKNPATDASVAITHLIKGENGGEVGTFEAFLDGKSLGVFTFSNNSSAGADYTLTAEAHGSGNSAGSNSGTLNIDDLVFDQLRFSAQEYASQGSSTDSSDYFIGGITYHEVPDVEFEYKVIDESNNPSEEVKVVIDVATDTPVPEADTNATPTTTDDSITTPEDTPYILTMDDFGTYSDETEAQKISIESLPTNGVLKLDGIEISANTEISVSDITTGKLSFTPSNDTDNDSSFNFKMSDGELWSDAHTTTVNVLAVADIPTASINVEETTSGTGTNITIVTLTKGISHVNYELSDGTKVKINYPDGTDIKDPTDATKYIDAIEAHTGKDVVGYEIKGGTYIFNQYGEYLREAVDADNSAVPEYNGSITENATYIFGDSSNLVYSVDITAALADTDNSETLTVSINGVPIGAVLSSDIYTLVDNNDGSWDVTVPAGIKTISDTLTMTTSEQHSDLNLNITARATETNENENGLNYKEATASDALINIEITDSTPNIDGDNIVYEEALTNSYDDREMTTGTFKITTEDGLSNISINGTTITESELLEIVATPKVITTTYGEIEINGYDATTGMVNYSYEIKENTTDHTVANQKDSVVDSISIKVTDTDGDTKETNLDVTIVDDIPTVSDQNAHLTFGADGTVTTTTTTNLVFTLDVSGSMTNNDGKITLDDGTQTDRLELAKDAIIDAVGAYMDQGAVNVNLTLFAETARMVDFSNATGQQSWMTVTANNFDSFKSIVNNVSNSGIGQYTNYEAAIDETVDSYNIGTPNADTTVAYFLSDGNPTAEMKDSTSNDPSDTSWINTWWGGNHDINTDTDGTWIDNNYITKWTNFITNNNIEIQALGIGTGIDTSAGSYLAQLAVGNNASVVEVTDPTKLSDTILGNITGTLSGNIFFGADAEGTIDSIKIGDIEYTKPTDSDETTITTTNGGSLTVDFTDGSYTFEAKQSQYDDGDKETFVVKVSDEDGDSATFNLNISMDSVSERFTLTSDTSTIDGGTGYDILDLDGHIDLGSIASRIDNIEEINLGDNNSNDTIHIDYEDIIDMTDTDNDLVIRGDNGDTINLDENDGWQRSDTTTNIDGEDFTEYTNTNNNTISVFIDNDLDTTGLN